MVLILLFKGFALISTILYYDIVTAVCKYIVKYSTFLMQRNSIILIKAYCKTTVSQLSEKNIHIPMYVSQTLPQLIFSLLIVISNRTCDPETSFRIKFYNELSVPRRMRASVSQGFFL